MLGKRSRLKWGSWEWARIRAKLFAECEGICPICGFPLLGRVMWRGKSYHPLSRAFPILFRGGSRNWIVHHLDGDLANNSDDNLVPLHRSCHSHLEARFRMEVKGWHPYFMPEAK